MKWFVAFSALMLIALPMSAQQLMSSHPSSAPAAQGMKLPAADVVKLEVTNKAVAKVNGVVLTDRDLVREEYAMFPYARQHGGLPRSMAAQIRQGALDMIIFDELVYQEGVRRGVVIPATKLDAAVAGFKAQFPDATNYQAYLKAECKGSPAVLREKIRRSMIIEKVMKQTSAKATVSLTEAKAMFDKNPQQFRVPESFAFQSISILPPSDKPTPAQLTDMKKRADEAYGKAKATKTYEEFGLLAEKISEDDFRVNMGDHKSVPTERIPEEVRKIAASMKPGEISGLLNLGRAYTIFRLNAYSPARQMKFEEVKDKLVSDMQKAKLNQLRADMGKRLRKDAKIEKL